MLFLLEGPSEVKLVNTKRYASFFRSIIEISDSVGVMLTKATANPPQNLQRFSIKQSGSIGKVLQASPYLVLQLWGLMYRFVVPSEMLVPVGFHVPAQANR